VGGTPLPCGPPLSTLCSASEPIFLRRDRERNRRSSTQAPAQPRLLRRPAHDFRTPFWRLSTAPGEHEALLAAVLPQRAIVCVQADLDPGPLRGATHGRDFCVMLCVKASEGAVSGQGVHQQVRSALGRVQEHRSGSDTFLPALLSGVVCEHRSWLQSQSGLRSNVLFCSTQRSDEAFRD
jgi:hypothetical protein